MLKKSDSYLLLVLLPFATKEFPSIMKKEDILSQTMELYCDTGHPDFCHPTKGGFLSSGQKALEWAVQQAAVDGLLERVCYGHYAMTHQGLWYLEDIAQQMALDHTLQQEPLFTPLAIQTLMQLYENAKEDIPARQAAQVRRLMNCYNDAM